MSFSIYVTEYDSVHALFQILDHYVFSSTSAPEKTTTTQNQTKAKHEKGSAVLYVALLLGGDGIYEHLSSSVYIDHRLILVSFPMIISEDCNCQNPK